MVRNSGDLIGRNIYSSEADRTTEYRFYPQNHSVARAAFGPNPCIPYEDTGAGLIGFWSGFRPTAVVSNTVRNVSASFYQLTDHFSASDLSTACK